MRKDSKIRDSVFEFQHGISDIDARSFQLIKCGWGSREMWGNYLRLRAQEFICSGLALANQILPGRRNEDR